MPRVATPPIDYNAAMAAMTETDKSFPITPSPGDSNYSAYQTIWMDAYIANGGKYTVQSQQEEAAQVEAAREKSTGQQGTSGVLQTCGPDDGSGPGYKPPPTPCPCKLTGIAISCGHGRSSRDGLLQIVVDDSFVGDPITIKPSASGGSCGTKLITRTGNFDGSSPTENKGTGSLTRETVAPAARQLTQLGWWRATPSVATVEATSCGGNAQMVRVERFPSGESKVQLNLSNILEGFTRGFSKLPVDARLFTQKGTPRKIRRKGEAKSEDFTLDGLKKRYKNNASTGGPEAVFKLASAWKEEKSSNHVYCDIAAYLGADPLFEAKFSILLYGIPIPSVVRKYVDVAAGIYLNVNGKVTLGAQVSVMRYPQPRDEWRWNTAEGILKGEVKFELAIELCVLSPKVLQAKGAGAVSAEASGRVRSDFSSKVYLDHQVVIGKLTASVTFKTLWGLIEYEREWPIFDGWGFDGSNEVLDLS